MNKHKRLYLLRTNLYMSFGVCIFLSCKNVYIFHKITCKNVHEIIGQYKGE